ncbi:MAG TPA: hypothetical protein VNX28_08715 [Gemmataceae bacterium]|jgi:hypothetical protein|nr:hypothetical protein [Gemmataceae bacterium]
MNEIWAKLLDSGDLLIDRCDGSDRFIIDREDPRYADVRAAVETPRPLAEVPLADLLNRIELAGPVDGKAFLDEFDRRLREDPLIMTDLDGAEDQALYNSLFAELIVSTPQLQPAKDLL